MSELPYLQLILVKDLVLLVEVDQVLLDEVVVDHVRLHQALILLNLAVVFQLLLDVSLHTFSFFLSLPSF